MGALQPSGWHARRGGPARVSSRLVQTGVRGPQVDVDREDDARVRRTPREDREEGDLEVGGEAHAAAGATAVAVAMKRAVEQMGVVRTAKTLLKLNQTDGFDCQGCAWPDPSPEHRHTAEFCENGAKAVAEEATKR